MVWRVASDFAERLKDLRIALGNPQWQEIARRAQVRPHQVTAWVRGRQGTTQTRLEAWAEREGWPVTIFAEGGPMPSTVVNRPAGERSAVAEAAQAPPYRGRPNASLTARRDSQRRVTDELEGLPAAKLQLLLRGAIMGVTGQPQPNLEPLLELLDALERALEREKKP